MSDTAMTRTVLVTLLDELLDGAGPDAAWMLNPTDPGLLASLAGLSAERASAPPAGGGGSIAAHVDHLRYGLQLLNRWSAGEEPFGDANYSASWERGTVSESEWRARLDELRREAAAWREAIQQPREVTPMLLTGMISSVAHLGYHFGAIRQIDRAARGPAAAD